jgi:hypothetical protein
VISWEAGSSTWSCRDGKRCSRRYRLVSRPEPSGLSPPLPAMRWSAARAESARRLAGSMARGESPSRAIVFTLPTRTTIASRSSPEPARSPAPGVDSARAAVSSTGRGDLRSAQPVKSSPPIRSITASRFSPPAAVLCAGSGAGARRPGGSLTRSGQPTVFRRIAGARREEFEEFKEFEEFELLGHSAEQILCFRDHVRRHRSRPPAGADWGAPWQRAE